MAKAKQYVRFPDGETYVMEHGLWKDTIAAGRAELLKGKEGEQAREEWLRRKLLEIIPVHATLLAICTYRASSGMSHRFRVFIPVATDSGLIIQEITSMVAEFCGFSTRHEEIQMSGCGYSKSFQIGYDLGQRLWPNGTPEPHGTRNGEPDSSGGYAIKVNG